jgi:hypothetical protein
VEMPLISHVIKGVAAHIHTHKDPSNQATPTTPTQEPTSCPA